MNYTLETENKIVKQELSPVKVGEVSEYKLKIELESEVSPSKYSIVWYEPMIDMYGFWSSKSFQVHNLTPEWWMRKNDSRQHPGGPAHCRHLRSAAQALLPGAGRQ